jgi:hypothetical protein
MPGVPIRCNTKGCPGPVVATYSHAHPGGPRTWTAPAVGPTPDGAPFPQPCPDDGTMCNATQVKCDKCNWTKVY